MSPDDTTDPRTALAAAMRADDVAAARALLEAHAELRPLLNRPAPELPFGALPLMALVQRRQREMIDLLLAFGANINGRSDWWAGGFGVLDGCEPDFAPFLIERGAVVDAHAAARLGMLDRLRALIDENPARVHARGGDGQTPLHFAANGEVAALLLARGADIDARDVDHESTPAQWMLRERREVARFLVARGCRTDLLMVTALGELERVRRLLDAEPASIRVSVNPRAFPMQNARAGGHIYIWTLGANRTAHQVARDFDHEDVLRLLMERSPAALRLADACWVGDEATVKGLLAGAHDLAGALTDEDRRRIADAAEDENATAVRLMLAAGWPVDAPGRHGGTALHWAAWHGHRELVKELLRHRPNLDLKDDDHQATPLGWATWSSVHGWHPERGDYAGVVEDLIKAGASRPEMSEGFEASEAVRAALKR